MFSKSAISEVRNIPETACKLIKSMAHKADNRDTGWHIEVCKRLIKYLYTRFPLWCTDICASMRPIAKPSNNTSRHFKLPHTMYEGSRLLQATRYSVWCTAAPTSQTYGSHTAIVHYITSPSSYMPDAMYGTCSHQRTGGRGV